MAGATVGADAAVGADADATVAVATVGGAVAETAIVTPRPRSAAALSAPAAIRDRYAARRVGRPVEGIIG